MPFTLQLDGTALNRTLAQVRNVLTGEELKGVLRAVGNAVGVTALASVSEYPAPSGKPLPLAYTRTVTAARPYYTPSGVLRVPGAQYKSKFKTLKQQRFVLASIRGAAGFKRISVPYRRTGALGRSIIYEIVALSTRLVVVSIGTNLSYARYVIDIDDQAPYFQNVWTPLQTDIAQALPAMQRAANVALVKAISNALNKK